MIQKTSQLYAEAVDDNGAKRFSQAVERFGKVIEESPDDALAYQGMAEGYYGLKRYDDALIACSKAVEINPSLAIAHEIRGFVYNERALYDKAEAELREAIRLDPKLRGAWIALGIAQYFMQHYSAAEESLSTAVGIDHLLGVGHYHLATCLFLQRKFDPALQSALRAFRLSPSLTSAEMPLFIIDRKYNGVPAFLFYFVFLLIAGANPLLALPIGLVAVTILLHISLISMRNRATRQVVPGLFLSALYIVGYIYTISLSFRK